MITQAASESEDLAHPGKRFQGQFIDGLVAYLLGFVSYYVIDAAIGREPAVYAGVAVGFIYFLLSGAFPEGQSVGKKLLKIQVVSQKTRQPCSLFQSFLRNVTPPLGVFDWVFILFGSHPSTRGFYSVHHCDQKMMGHCVRGQKRCVP